MTYTFKVDGVNYKLKKCENTNTYKIYQSGFVMFRIFSSPTGNCQISSISYAEYFNDLTPEVIKIIMSLMYNEISVKRSYIFDIYERLYGMFVDKTKDISEIVFSNEYINTGSNNKMVMGLIRFDQNKLYTLEQLNEKVEYED